MTSFNTLRLDKWLWSARFFKTRSLAVEEIGKGRVLVNGLVAKPARELKLGDTVAFRQGAVARTVVVRGLSTQRGPAPVAQLLFAETEDSVAKREKAAENRRLAPEPAAELRHGRPTKRDRRELERPQTWDTRWSASADR